MDIEVGHKYLLKSEDKWDSYLFNGHTIDKSLPTVGMYLKTIEDNYSNILHLFAVIGVNREIIGLIEFEDGNYTYDFIIEELDDSDFYKIVLNPVNTKNFNSEEFKKVFDEYMTKAVVFVDFELE